MERPEVTRLGAPKPGCYDLGGCGVSPAKYDETLGELILRGGGGEDLHLYLTRVEPYWESLGIPKDQYPYRLQLQIRAPDSAIAFKELMLAGNAKGKTGYALFIYLKDAILNANPSEYGVEAYFEAYLALILPSSGGREELARTAHFREEFERLRTLYEEARERLIRTSPGPVWWPCFDSRTFHEMIYMFLRSPPEVRLKFSGLDSKIRARALATMTPEVALQEYLIQISAELEGERAFGLCDFESLAKPRPPPEPPLFHGASSIFRWKAAIACEPEIDAVDEAASFSCASPPHYSPTDPAEAFVQDFSEPLAPAEESAGGSDVFPLPRKRPLELEAPVPVERAKARGGSSGKRKWCEVCNIADHTEDNCLVLAAVLEQTPSLRGACYRCFRHGHSTSSCKETHGRYWPKAARLPFLQKAYALRRREAADACAKTGRAMADSLRGAGRGGVFRKNSKKGLRSVLAVSHRGDPLPASSRPVLKERPATAGSNASLQQSGPVSVRRSPVPVKSVAPGEVPSKSKEGQSQPEGQALEAEPMASSTNPVWGVDSCSVGGKPATSGGLFFSLL